jgi:hypothetical protein
MLIGGAILARAATSSLPIKPTQPSPALLDADANR